MVGELQRIKKLNCNKLLRTWYIFFKLTQMVYPGSNRVSVDTENF